jgi:hypothetical protein
MGSDRAARIGRTRATQVERRGERDSQKLPRSWRGSFRQVSRNRKRWSLSDSRTPKLEGSTPMAMSRPFRPRKDETRALLQPDRLQRGRRDHRSLVGVPVVHARGAFPARRARCGCLVYQYEGTGVNTQSAPREYRQTRFVAWMPPDLRSVPTSGCFYVCQAAIGARSRSLKSRRARCALARIHRQPGLIHDPGQQNRCPSERE